MAPFAFFGKKDVPDQRKLTAPNVETASGWRKALTPAKDGTVTLDTPMPGLYVLEISARVNNGSVTLDGKKFEDIRYTATLSFEVLERSQSFRTRRASQGSAFVPSQPGVVSELQI